MPDPDSLGVPGFVARVALDPTNHQHVIINFHDNCTKGHTPVCFGESKDGGTTWNVLDFPTSLQNGWGEGTAVWPIDATHWLFEDWNLYYTGDAGQNWKEVDTGGYAAIQGPFTKSPDGTFFIPSANGVISSPDGENWTKIDNSGGPFDAISACGDSVYALVGFQPPTTPTIAWSANYKTPSKWAAVAADAIPQPIPAGGNSMECDHDHQIVYSAILATGLWRMVGSGGVATSSGGSAGSSGSGDPGGSAGSSGVPAN